MKEKIALAIKTKFPKVNLSKKRLDAIVAKIETKVIDDETKIDAAIDDFNDYNPLVEIAKSDDRVRDLEAKVKPATDPKTDPTEPATDPASPVDDMPAWAKALMGKVDGILGEKTATTIRSKAAEALKDVPEKFWGKRLLPDTAEGIEAFAAEVTADYAEFAQTHTNNELGKQTQPATAANAVVDAKVDPLMKAYADAKATKLQAEAVKN